MTIFPQGPQFTTAMVDNCKKNKQVSAQGRIAEIGVIKMSKVLKQIYKLPK